jgi:hypothetical protein
VLDTKNRYPRRANQSFQGSHPGNRHNLIITELLGGNSMIDVLDRAEQRLHMAHEILTQLQLFERWRIFGTPVLVGAVAYGLAMAPDIDMEIYCDVPRIEHGFVVLQDCALHPNVRKAHFGNYLDEADEGLYWRLIYRTDDGIDWKIDMWSLRRDHPGPCAAQLVEPLRQALTPETRRAILELKALNVFLAPHESEGIY